MSAFGRGTMTLIRLGGLPISSVPPKGSAVAGGQDPYIRNVFPIIHRQLTATV